MSSISIGTFFSQCFFKIPKYQRGYAWEQDHVRELFEDIKESIESGSNHYIGTMVLAKGDDDAQYYVVDGQQRITTLTMIINALIKRLSAEEASFYKRCYIKDPKGYRLVPLGRDQAFFFGLLEGENQIPDNKSQRLLSQAHTEITSTIELIPNPKEFLESVEKLELMRFIEPSEGDAIRIFQTVNDRGKALSNMEKIKSLLIYFSNRYLNKALDSKINDRFSDMFEYYDDISQTGNDLGIALIKSRSFSEDNLMRYHFVTYYPGEYEPTAEGVLTFVKKDLSELRKKVISGETQPLFEYIDRYSQSLCDFFSHCKNVTEKAKTIPQYYKLFVILGLSATLYPLITKLEMKNLLDKPLINPNMVGYTFLDLVELIDVRVYKTRGTDPRKDIANIVYNIDNTPVGKLEEQLTWFNTAWMPRELFLSNLSGNMYHNEATTHILLTYSESMHKEGYTIDTLKTIVSQKPTKEHILSQKIDFTPETLGFKDDHDFDAHKGWLGNLTILESKLNTGALNKNILEKLPFYDQSQFLLTKKTATLLNMKKTFSKIDLHERTREIANYCVDKWRC